MTVVIELGGLEIFGHHGVTDDERRAGQLFLYDVEYEVGDESLSDRLEATVDYRDVAACVREISDGRQYALLEALAGAVADALLDRFPADRVRVRVRKPGVTLEVPLAYSAAAVERRRARP